MAERPTRSPRALLRHLRSLLPVSPLPRHWHRRFNRGLLAAIVLLVAGGAVASVLIQRSDDSDEAESEPAAAPPALAGPISRMSVEQKVETVLALGASTPKGAVALARTPALGAVVATGGEWGAAKPAARDLQRLRRATPASRGVPLLVGRQEGGIYRAYPDLPPAETQREIGVTGDPALAETWARTTAAALSSRGFDLNLAPVADVATLDSPIADRAFSDVPSQVGAMTAAAIRGCRQGGLACAVSHFPGLGGASDDTAAGPATVSLDEAAIEARELIPFRAAFEQAVPAVVVSLAFYAAFDSVTPAALSPTVVDELLRDQLGFKGVAITDDLSSGAIAAGLGAPEAAVQALAAGSDLLQVTDPAEAAPVRQAVLEAARSGAVPRERLDEAVARVLQLKRNRGLLPAEQ